MLRKLATIIKNDIFAFALLALIAAISISLIMRGTENIENRDIDDSLVEVGVEAEVEMEADAAVEDHDTAPVGEALGIEELEGYCDIVVPFKYTYITDFEDGLASVRVGDLIQGK